MPKTSKNRKALVKMQNNRTKKTGGLFTAYVNIDSYGVILNKGAERYKREMETFTVRYGGGQPKNFYEQGHTGLGRSGKSIIPHKTISNLISHGVVCSSIVETATRDNVSWVVASRFKTEKTPIIFVFDKDATQTQASISRMTRSNYYTIKILSPLGIKLPDRVLQKIVGLKGVEEGDTLPHVKVQVNKDDSDFWFNLKPYVGKDDDPHGFIDDLIKNLSKKQYFVKNGYIIPNTVTNVVGIIVPDQVTKKRDTSSREEDSDGTSDASVETESRTSSTVTQDSRSTSPYISRLPKGTRLRFHVDPTRFGEITSTKTQVPFSQSN